MGAPGGEGRPVREARVASAVRRQGVPAIQNSFRDGTSERWTPGSIIRAQNFFMSGTPEGGEREAEGQGLLDKES